MDTKPNTDAKPNATAEDRNRATPTNGRADDKPTTAADNARKKEDASAATRKGNS